jgi:hypothetical protein
MTLESKQMTPAELSDALIKKYNLNSVQDVLDWIDTALLELEQTTEHDK